MIAAAASIESVLLVVILLIFMWTRRQYNIMAHLCTDYQAEVHAIGRVRLVVEHLDYDQAAARVWLPVNDVDFRSILGELDSGRHSTGDLEILRTPQGVRVRVYQEV